MVDLSRFPRRKDAGPAATPQSTDPYEQVISRMSGDPARANLLDDSTSPADAIQAKQLSRRMGMPAEAISADTKGFSAEDGMKAWNDVIDSSPGLRQFLGNSPLNAAAARDDREALANVSQTFQTADQAGDPLGQRYLGQLRQQLRGTSVLGGARPAAPIMDAFKRGVTDTISRKLAGDPNAGMLAPDPLQGGRAATVGNIATGHAANFVYNLNAPLLGAGRYLADTLGIGDQFAQSDYVIQKQRQLEELQAFGDVRYTPMGHAFGMELNPGQWAYSAADSLAQMGAAFTTGQPLTVLSMGTGLEFYNRARARGAGATESAFGAAATGAIEAATELLPLDYLEHNFGKKAIGKFLIGYLPKEVGGELLATVGQNAADALVTGGVGWDQYLKTLPQDLLDTAGSTLFMGGMLGALNKVAQRSQPEARTMLDIGRATAGAAWVDQLMTNSAESKLRAADPETFKEFVDTHTQDSPVRNLYVPVEAIRALQQSEGYEPGFFERFQDQIDQAEATQGDVVIPISEAASELAGTPQWEAIKDQTRIYPGGLSQKEALAQHDEIMRTLEQRGAEIAKEVAEGTDSPASEVYTEVKNRLLAGGVQSRQAETVAQLYAARYETRASQMGGTAMEQFKAAKIVFPGEQPGSTGGREVAQLVEGERRVLGEKLTREDAQQLTAYWNDVDPGSTTMQPTRQATQERRGARYDVVRVATGNSRPSIMNLSSGAGVFADAKDNVDEMGRPVSFEIQRPADGTTLFQSAEDLAQHVPGLDKVLPYLEQDERDRLKKRSAARIVELVDTFPSAEEMASVAFAGRAKRGWYERSAQALLDIFGMEDSSRFAALLAATSPQTSVESNTINALAIWVNWDKAGRPTDEKSIIKIMGKSVQGRKGADSILPAWINNTVRALSADNAADVKLSGPKVNSFMANLVGAVDEVTNDAWMANYALIDQSLFKGTPQKAADGSTIAAKSPGYIAFSALVRRAADILTERTGETWTPAEVQETVWSFTKILTEKRDSAGSIPVDQILAAGGLTHEDIGGTPDFAMLFQRGIYRNILEAGGYGEAVADLEGSAQADGSSGKQGTVTNAEGSGLDPAVFLEHLGTAGGRIEVRVGRERKTTGDQQRDLFAGFNLQPLTGLPGLIKVDGVPVQFGPFGPARESARRYMLRNGYPYSPPTDYVKVDVERAKRIAQAFEEMKHDPEDPQVKAAYRAMIDETVAQYREIEKTGLTVEFIDGEDPYGNPRNAILDVTENNHLWVFPTDTGFGGPSSQAVDISGNPLLEVVPGVTISGRPVRANDIFRIVHDYFGHIKEGVGFRADGEENAWRVHSSMYSPLARRAMTTETRGQNSWVNFGPFGEQNQKAGPGDTEYAPQKIGLLPDWVSREGSGLEGRVLNQDVMEVDDRGVTNTPPGRVTVYHGTPYEFDTFKTAGGALWFADTPELAKRYADPRRVRKLGEGRIIPADVTITKPLMVNDDGVVPDGAAWAKEQFGFDLKAHGWERVGQDYSHAVTRSAAFADAARAAGFDAIGRPEGNGMTWGILNKNSVTDPDTQRTLYQSKQGPRGSVTFTAAGERVIQLFDSANASTLLHESSHIWLEELRDDAANPAAPQQVRDDWAKIERWFAEQGQPIQPGIPIPTEAHELFARGGERYFMEGKAPSGVLAGAFKTFRAWLLRIYQVAANLRSPINDDVRGVFDRLLATQDAIDQYKSQAGVEPLFKTATEAGMTDAEFAAYQRSVSDARDEAYDAMLYRTMEAIRRQRTVEGRERRRSVRDGVAAEINAQPQFVALHLLRTGMWLGDPNRPRQDVKLNTGWLIDTFGEDILDKLPRGLPITKGDGVDGDTVAEMVGAESGQQLVHALVGMRAASEALRAEGEKRSLRDRMIEDRTDELMAQRYGDPLNDGSIEEEAVAALNTARQGEVIAQEARQLAKRNPTVTQPLTPYQFAREWAKRVVSQGRVSDVASRMALQRYTRATAKAQRAAEKAILDGDTAEAYKQKQAQLLNHALLAEAKAAAEDVDTIVARMRKLAGRAAMKSVDQDYLDKVHMLLERYDFRPRSQKSIDEAEGFQAWLEGQRAKGFEVHIPPRLENKGDPFSRVSVEELRSLNDLVESLMHLGRTKQTLKIAKQDRDFGEFRDEVAARIRQLPVRKLPEKPINEEKRFGASTAAELLKVETIVEELDGGKTGPLHDALILGATEAENLRHKLRQQVLHPIARAYKKLSNKQWARFQEKVTIPELTWNSLNEGDPRLGQPVTMTRSELISVLLNMGNLSNLEKLSKGERWPVATLHAVIQRELTKEDFDFAQLLWDQINSLWPQIVATERELSGVVPEQVVPTPIDTPYGTYAGGYWPVVYDADRWQRAEDLEGKQLDDMFGLKSGVATQKGHTITRTAAFGPIQLSLENVMFAHLEQVVTRLSFSAYARDVLRIIRDKTIRGLIDTHLGPEYRKQIEPWLARQIHNGAVHTKAARYWQRILRQFRVNMTVAAMGFRISTGVAQTVGLTASAQRIGAKYVGVGLKRLALSPIKMAKFVDERSPEMANRMGAVNREVSDVFAKLRGKHSKFTEMQAWAMWHIGMVDRYVVSIPTWLGAHQKGLDQGMTDYEASAYADKEVRLSQGAGSEKDMSAFQSPNNEAMKFFSMFYTPFNVLFNAQWQGVRGLKQGNIRPMIGVTFWWMIASVLGDALLSGDWPENDEGEIDWESLIGWFSRNVFFGLFAGIPIARDIASTAENQVAGKYAPPLSTPVSRVWDTVDQSIKDGHRYADTGELPRDPIKKIGNTAAVVTGTPLSQLGTTGQFAWDYSTGEANPQNVSDWYFGITKGKVPANDGSK